MSGALTLSPDDLVFIGRPDLAVIRPSGAAAPAPAGNGASVLEVEVPITDEIGEYYLEVREVPSGQLVTVVELLSPVNKVGGGRAQYLAKRNYVFKTLTNLVEIDLLRGGEPMPLVGGAARRDDAVLVSRGTQRPRARLYTFGLRQPIPDFPLPLLPGDAEPLVALNAVLHGVYQRARFDLVVDYAQPAVPPLAPADDEWARGLLGAR